MIKIFKLYKYYILNNTYISIILYFFNFYFLNTNLILIIKSFILQNK